MKFEVGDKVLVSQNAWVVEPGGFVDPYFFGKVGTVVGPGLDDSMIVTMEGYSCGQYIDPSCLTLVEGENDG